MKTILTALAAITLTAGLLLSCAPPVAATASDSNDRALGQFAPGGIRVTVTTNKPQYRVGERVVMTLKAVNTADYPITLVFATDQRYDFTVSYYSMDMWKWSAGKVFPQVVGRITLKPAQSIVYQTMEYKAQMPPPILGGATLNLSGTLTSLYPAPVSGSTTFKVIGRYQ